MQMHFTRFVTLFMVIAKITKLVESLQKHFQTL